MKAENTTRIQFDSLSVNEAYARGAVAAFLAHYDPTVPQLADIKTAVSEAVTNCIVHAYPDRVGQIVLTVSVYPDRRVRITVADKGVGIPDIAQAMEPLFTTGDPRGTVRPGLCSDAELYGWRAGGFPSGAGHPGDHDQASDRQRGGYIIYKREAAMVWYRTRPGAARSLKRI